VKRSLALAGALLTLAGAFLTLAGCGSSASPDDPAASPSKPLWSMAPVVGNACEHVDQTLVAKMVGQPSVKGTSQARPSPLQAAPAAHSCWFKLATGVDFVVGIGPIPMAYAIPGAEEAMSEMRGAGAGDPGAKVDGAGDLAYYSNTDGLFVFNAVQGDGVRWYGVTIEGDDPTPDHWYFGKVTQEDLVTLAKGCLAGL
jgi:hypothetical protein